MMIFIFLALTIAALWINMVGAGLALYRWHKDYPIARVASVPLACLVLFGLEHFVGLGPHPPLLIPASLGSLWLIWRHRTLLWEHRSTELFFALGFIYVLFWRCTFPDIDLGPERLPDLMFIQSYSVGDTLPAIDRWLPPFRLNFYYSFQHYSAALIGRSLRVSPEISFQLGVCALAGLVSCAVGSATRRVCAWRPGPWLVVAFILMGGNGVIIGLHALSANPPAFWMSSRFLGLGVAAGDWNWLGRLVSHLIPMGRPGIELPMDTFSYTIGDLEFHAPQFGFVLLALMSLLILAQEAGAAGRVRVVNHALLGACLVLGMLGNIWIVPLQGLFILGWIIYRWTAGERGHLAAVVAGVAAAALFAYPHLLEFTRAHTIATPLRPTLPSEHSPVGDWLWMFWPALLILLFSLAGRERPAKRIFHLALWLTLLGFSEFMFVDDIYSGTWNRFNSTLKWWPWVYSGIFLTVGATNLGSSSRLRRWGTVAVILCTLLYTLDLERLYTSQPKPSILELDGSHWIAGVQATHDLVRDLDARPDGIALESGDPRGVTETTALTAFGHKASFLGWPAHEEFIWRGPTPEVTRRQTQLDLFYKDKLPDPLEWLQANNIRYILWLQRDQDPCFLTLREKIGSRYSWHAVYGNDTDWFIGFFELRPASPAPSPAPLNSPR